MSRALSTIPLLLLLAGCDCDGEGSDVADATDPSSAPVAEDPPASTNRLMTDASDFDFSRNPEVLDRVVRSRFAYFRFVAIPFGQAICDEFEDNLNVFPMVNLHGDAHIEQYAISGEAHGLDDFDRATVGPAVVDLVRFAASLVLVAELKGFDDSADPAIDAFLDSYRDALDDPETEVDIPTIATRLAASHSRSAEEFLEWAESLMAPVPEDTMPGIRRAVAGFGELMCEQDPELTPQYFLVERFGRLTLGIGSGLVTKYLARVRGPTPDPLDDRIIEFKEVQPGQPSCTVPLTSGGMLRPIVGDARLGRSQGRILGFVPVPPEEENDGPTFWAKSWEAGYHEITVAEIASREELIEIARDVGNQLGKGHVRQIAEPMTPQLRRAQLDALERARARVRSLAKALAAEVTPAWRDLRRQVDRDDPEESY